MIRLSFNEITVLRSVLWKKCHIKIWFFRLNFFHKVFFPGKTNWKFNPETDPIINILTSKVWINLAILVFLIIIILVSGIIIYEYYKKEELEEITLAYAITIHKSQGSDYKNILVILPTSKVHPLLNRQIIYTAITRTKGNTYILSNHERLIEAKDTVLIRDTNII